MSGVSRVHNNFSRSKLSCPHLYGVCYRAVAAGPVSPVSTGPLFPSPVACLALPISAIVWRTPTQRPEAHRYQLKLARWLRTVQQNCSASLPTTFRFYKRMISLASFTCEGCGFRPISKLDRKTHIIGVRRNGQNGIHVKLSSSLRCNHDQQYSIPFAHTNHFKYSFLPNSISVWNNLPLEAVNCTTLPMFKYYTLPLFL